MAFINDRLGLVSLAIANIAANGAIGTAAATVDIASQFNVTQTTASITLTVPNPTVATAGYVCRINNTGTASFTVLGVLILPDKFIDLNWDGTSWNLEAGGGTVKIYRVVQALVAGANVITHNLALITPFPSIVSVRDNTTGEEVSMRATLETANTLTLSPAAAYAGASVTILG